MSDCSNKYKEAGVDIGVAEDFVERLKPLAQTTFTKGVINDIGGFGGLYKPDLTNIEEPVLVASTDGVGTKLKLAFQLNKHDTVGIDLVAMCANDVLVQGARPLFFLDYFSTGKLDADLAEKVISGVATGCQMAGCALLGGETAEMPGFYPQGEYDLAGFCVGLADLDRVVDGFSVSVEDVLIGISSSGPHANGYSLIRKIIADADLSLGEVYPGLPASLGDILLEPTRIYVKNVLNILRDFGVKGMVHVTGGGFYGNISRVLPKNVYAHIDSAAFPIPTIFHFLRERGEISWQEMFQVFNCGIGFILIVSKNDAEEVLNRLKVGLKEESWIIGEIKIRGDEDPEQEQVLVDLPE